MYLEIAGTLENLISDLHATEGFEFLLVSRGQ